MITSFPIDFFLTSLACLIGIGLVSLQVSLGNISEEEELLSKVQSNEKGKLKKRSFLKSRKE